MCVHRIIWAIHNGEDPGELQVDHINGKRNDNRIGNLRLVTPSENDRNRNIRKGNVSGVTGVSYHKGKKMWDAGIGYKGKLYRRCYKDKNHAIAARCLAEYRLFGEHSKLLSKALGELKKDD